MLKKFANFLQRRRKILIIRFW
uniref:Uncharacterized protein n=1 Tax=Romanomermis culicivorax TaxID=13658 RepID=A0A915J0X2_ROMCU